MVTDESRTSLNINGDEILSIHGLSDDLSPQQILRVELEQPDGTQSSFKVLCRIDTVNEVEYFKAGGILHYVLRHLIAS